MKRVLIDTNVVLDVLLDREPFVEDAAAIWQAVEDQTIQPLHRSRPNSPAGEVSCIRPDRSITVVPVRAGMAVSIAICRDAVARELGVR